MEEGNKIALVERAACYLKLGKNSLALADAEESLKENKKFTKVLTIYKNNLNLIIFNRLFFSRVCMKKLRLCMRWVSSSWLLFSIIVERNFEVT